MKAKRVAVPALAAAVALAAAAAVFGWYRAAAADRALASARAESEAVAAALGAELASSTAALAASRAETAQLVEQLAAEKERNDKLAKDTRRAVRKADELQELAKLDQELLAKYSKVYFLNENFAPPATAEIPAEFRMPAEKHLEIHAEVLPRLTEMLADAREDGVDIAVASAYRSFDEQAVLKGRYTVTYGSTAANSFSADQGYSEHQLGTTVDFTSASLGGGLSGFERTAAYEWLEENAFRYGFVLSYPEENTYYVYEPWHWRFVGESLSRYLHKKGVRFYDMDQREIDDYLGEIFE